jgi:hypothetical protein
MGLFKSSVTSITEHGVYAIERDPPALMGGIGMGTACLIGQFPWGPSYVGPNSEAAPHVSTSTADMANTFAPPGMTRTGTGYLALIRKTWPDLRIIRVVGTAAAASSANLVDGATTIMVATLKYPGVAGNSVTFTISDASDGNANHFNLSVTVTGASGTTTDLVQNVNANDTAYTSPDLSSCILLGTLTRSTTGRPDNVVGSAFSGGADGTINSTQYIGTAGAGDFGIAAAENDDEVDFVFADDPGDSDRAAVMTALVAHAELMGDRRAVIHLDSGITSIVTLRGDAILTGNRSWLAALADGWVRIRDDVDATIRTVPSDSFLVSLLCQLPPSTSAAAKNSKVMAMLRNIVSLETPRGTAAGTNADHGISTIKAHPKGGWCFEACVTTLAPSTPAKRLFTRSGMGIYVAQNFKLGASEYVDSPNVEAIQDEILIALKAMMEVLKKNAKVDPFNLPHVIDYNILDPAGFNTTQSMALGYYYVPLDMQTSAGMEKIILSFRFGENVTIYASDREAA